MSLVPDGRQLTTFGHALKMTADISASYTPALSIIMPMYNVEAYIETAVQSILNQSWPDFELIIVNDGSIDHSLSIAELLCRSDPRVRIVSQANKGLAAARNRGLEESSGSYVYFFDSDDILLPDALQTCMTQAQDMGLDLVAFAGEAFIDGTDHIQETSEMRKPDRPIPQTGQHLLFELSRIKCFSVSCCLYIFSRRLLENPDLRFDEGFIHEDEAFTVLLYCKAQRAISLAAPFFRRRIRPLSIMTTRLSAANIAGCMQAMQRIAKAEAALADLDPMCRTALRWRQRSLLRQAVIDAFSCRKAIPLISLLGRKVGLSALLRIDPLIGPFAAWQLLRPSILRARLNTHA